MQVSLCIPFSSSGDAEGLEQDPQSQQHHRNPSVCQYQGNSLSLALIPRLEPRLCTILWQELETLESKAGLTIICNYFNSFRWLSSGFLRHILPWLSGAASISTGRGNLGHVLKALPIHCTAFLVKRLYKSSTLTGPLRQSICLKRL